MDKGKNLSKKHQIMLATLENEAPNLLPPSLEYDKNHIIEHLIQERSQFYSALETLIEDSMLSYVKTKFGVFNMDVAQCIVDRWINTVKVYVVQSFQGHQVTVTRNSNEDVEYIIGGPYESRVLPSEFYTRCKPTEREQVCFLLCGYKVCISDEPTTRSHGN